MSVFEASELVSLDSIFNEAAFAQLSPMLETVIGTSQSVIVVVK
jgi:hypothetical protein